MRVKPWCVGTFALGLAAGALASGCQDYKWSPNASPVCNETVQSTVQPIIKALDILFVIDNSGTMREEQASLAANFDRFVDKLVESDADYQIGVITTAVDPEIEAGGGNLVLGKNPDGTQDTDPAHKIINQASNRGIWTDAEIGRIFKQNIVQGTTGTSFEKGLEAVRRALSPAMLNKPLSQGGNQGFLRDDSTLGIVFVSDENDCSHTVCPVGDESCIQEADPLFECDDKASTLISVDDYFDFLVDEDGAGPADDGLRAPKKIIVAGIIGVRDADTEQQVCIRTKQGEVRKLDVACWPIDPLDKVPPDALGSDGQIYDVDPDAKGAKFSVPDAVHTFDDTDVGKLIRIAGAGEECNNGVWRITQRDAGANAVFLLRGDDLFQAETGIFWEMGQSPGMATEGSRYATFISRFSRGLVNTICTFEWDETLDRLGASFTLQFLFCLGDPPAGLEDLMAEYVGREQQACPAIEDLVRVKVDGAFVSCNDSENPWHIEKDPGSCSTGSGYKVFFPNSRREDCALEPPGDDCFPAPGTKAEIFYLSQEGNSERCIQTDED